MPNLFNAGLSTLQSLWRDSARTTGQSAAVASPSGLASGAASASGETDPLLSPRGSRSSALPPPRNAIVSHLKSFVPKISSAADAAVKTGIGAIAACCGGTDAASISDQASSLGSEARDAREDGASPAAASLPGTPDPGFIGTRQHGESVLPPAVAEPHWSEVLGVHGSWLQIHRIAEDCVGMPNAQHVIRNALHILALEVEDAIRAHRDPASDEVPPEVQAARDKYMSLHAEAITTLDAFAQLQLPPLQHPATIGTDWVTQRGKAAAIPAALAVFKEELDRRVAALTELHQGTLPDDLWYAKTTCVRLHEQASRVIAAYERIGIQAPWMAPPERDLRCITMEGITDLQAQLDQVEGRLAQARAEAQRLDEPLSQPLQQAIDVYDRLRNETASAVKLHESYLREAPTADPGIEVDPRDEGLLGFETETARLNFKKFLVRGTPVARVSKGRMESDVGRTLDGGVVANFESVSETLKNPWHVERYARSTRNFFRSMKREARTTGSSPPINSFLHPSRVIRNVEATPRVYIRNGVAVALQTTSGLYLLEHVPAVLRALNPDTTLQGLEDATRVSQLFRQKHGRNLSAKAFGLISYIACYIRWANIDGVPKSAHSKIGTMSRKSFSSMYSSSLKSEQDRDDIRWLLDPECGNGCPPMMEMLGYAPDEVIYKNGYLVPPPASDDVERAPVKPILARGPLLMDWLVSIFNPAAFGRDTDLVSPPEGHDRQAKKQHGMGNLGDVNKVTGELIVEDRGDIQRPRTFPASALPAACMLEYMKWLEYNPRLARLDPVVRDQNEKQESMRIFRVLSKLYIDLSDFAADIHCDRPQQQGILDGSKAALASVHETLQTSLDAKDIGGECEALLEALSPVGPGAKPDKNLGRRAEELVDKLDEAFPRFMEILFAQEFKVWRKWLDENSPSTRPSSSSSEGASSQ